MNFCDFPISNSKGVCHRQRTTEYENNGITKFFLKDLIKESSLKNNDIASNQVQNNENNFQQNDKNQSFNVSYIWETDTISGLRFINVLNKKDKKKLGFQCIYCRDKQLFKKKSSVLYHMVTFNHGLKTSVIEELKINERNSDDRLDFINNFNVEKPITKKKENEVQKESVNDYNLIKLEIEFVSTLNLLTHEELKTLFLLFFPEDLLSVNEYMNKENIIENFLLNINSISKKYSGTIKETYNSHILNKDVNHITLNEYLNELKNTAKAEYNIKCDKSIGSQVIINELMNCENKIYEEKDTYEGDKKIVSESGTENENVATKDIEKSKKVIPEENKKEIIEDNKKEIIEDNKKEIIEDNKKEIIEDNKKEIIENKKEIVENKKEIIEENKNNIIEKSQNNIIENNNKKNKKEIIKSNEKNHIIININDYDIFKHNDKLFINLTAHKEKEDNKQNMEKEAFLIINNSAINNENNDIEVNSTSNHLENINTQRNTITDHSKENVIGVLLNMNNKIKKNKNRNETKKKIITNVHKKSRKNEKNSLHEKLKIDNLGKRSSFQETLMEEISIQENFIKESSINENLMEDNLIENNLDKENNSLNLNKKKYILENHKKNYYIENFDNNINKCINSVDIETNNNSAKDNLCIYNNNLPYMKNNVKGDDINDNKSKIENNHINNAESTIKINEVNNTENNLNLNDFNLKNTNGTSVRKINYEKKNINNNNILVNHENSNCILSMKEIKKKRTISNKILKENEKQKIEYGILFRRKRNVKSTYSTKFLEEKKIMNIKKKHTKKIRKIKKPTYINYEKNICNFVGKKKILSTREKHKKKMTNKSKRKKIENSCTFLIKEIKQLCNLSKENIIQHNDVNLLCTRSYRLSRYVKK
ncbi:conserved Plasmodium protein, unknown function [Plasmodium relictum]|uniref:Uncharacterized protein n=1 Tax=Plasmodium relictum TaxID=85471 RepID=A0A1J1HB62_PLARL|nr:conserved Plasmodium protein, unknown function [Plasmodium relictum]CRH02737.1 conserved Plasmodium protein, unknown function [Plasmodium relictum]